jgi:hypothetical protein
MGKVGGGYLGYSKCSVMGYCVAGVKLPVENTCQRIYIELHLVKIEI